MQKKGRTWYFAAGLLHTMAKSEEYSKDSHVADVILANIPNPFLV